MNVDIFGHSQTFTVTYINENQKQKSRLQKCVVCSRNDKRKRLRYQYQIFKISYGVTLLKGHYHTVILYYFIMLHNVVSSHTVNKKRMLRRYKYPGIPFIYKYP